MTSSMLGRTSSNFASHALESLIVGEMVTLELLRSAVLVKRATAQIDNVAMRPACFYAFQRS